MSEKIRTGEGASVSVRDATIDDVDVLSRVMHMAARSHLPRGLWEYIYDLSEEETLRWLRELAVAEPIHFCHWSMFQIAEVDGTPGAALCGFDPETEGMGPLMMAMPPAFEAAGIVLTDWDGVVQRAAVVQRVNAEHAKGAWVIENVAADPAFRRRGLIDALLRSILDRGRSKGFELAQIAVLMGNAPARNAYLKAGFEHVDEKRDAEFEAGMNCAGVERLLQPLD